MGGAWSVWIRAPHNTFMKIAILFGNDHKRIKIEETHFLGTPRWVLFINQAQLVSIQFWYELSTTNQGIEYNNQLFKE